MKALTRLFTFLSLLQLASCMPDSLTSFDKKVEQAEDVSGGTVVETPDNSDGTLTGISISQVQGDNIILKVDNNSNFVVGNVINVSPTAAVSISVNNIGSVIAVTESGSDRYVTITLNAATAIPGTYISAGNFIDNCSLGYGLCLTPDIGAALVELTGFYIDQTSSFSKTFNPIASNTSMSFDYSVSPSLPNGIQVDENTIGLNTDDAIESPIGPFRVDPDNFSETPYTFTVSVTNFGLELDSSETQELSVLITGKIPGEEASDVVIGNGITPSAVGVGRYQFIRLDSNANRFERGSRISVNTIDDNREIKGRVLLSDSDNGILVEATHKITEGNGIDNTSKFFANESLTEDYAFIYLQDITDFDVNDTISTIENDTAIIESINLESNLLFVKILNGNFREGELIIEDDITQTSTAISALFEQNTVSGVLEVGSVAAFNIGSSVSTASGAEAIVMGKDSVRNYLFILTFQGTFSDGEGVDNSRLFNANETVINSIIGPIVDTVVAGGLDTSSGINFREGSLVSSSNGVLQRGSGYAVGGTDLGLSKLVIQVENYKDGGSFDSGNNLDDFTQTNIALGAPHTLASVSLSNLVISYVNEPVEVLPHVRGTYSLATISPEKLPNGLEFDTRYGRIFGTPTEPASLKDYTITYVYPGEGSVSYTFPLVVYSQFEVSQSTGNGSSYLLHKEGRGLAGSKCKVFGPQVIDDPNDPNFGNNIQSFNDVYCRLEAGEQDLYKEGIEFNVTSGGGMCEFIRYKPFSYNSITNGSTDATYVRYSEFNDANKCGAGSVVISAEAAPFITEADMIAGSNPPTSGRLFNSTYCVSGDCIVDDSMPSNNLDDKGFCRNDHSQLDDGRLSYKNTDSGSYRLVTVSCSVLDEATSECGCTAAVEEKSCDGDVSNSIEGPINDVAEINKSLVNSYIYSSFDPFGESLKVKAPIETGNIGNFRVANYTAKNACYASTPYHIEDSVALGATNLSDTWESFNDSNDPFGGVNLNQFYTFECLNAAGDLKARVRLQVREWNKTFTPETSGLEELIPASLMDDTSSTCFGTNCNNSPDYDDIIGTNFGTCGTSIPLTNDVISVDLEAGSFIVKANGADTFNATNYQRGTKIRVGSAGFATGELTFVVEEYIDNQTLKVTTASPQTATALDIEFYDGYRFPLEGE